MNHIHLFISTVTDEFGSYRKALLADLDRYNLTTKIQENFVHYGTATLDKLDDYIRHCDAVVQIAGDMTGSPAPASSVACIREKYPRLSEKMPVLQQALSGEEQLSYTQWEALLAIFHGKELYIAIPEPGVLRDEKYVSDDAQKQSQKTHVGRLAAFKKYPFSFANADRLVITLFRSKLFDLLARAGKRPRAVLLYNEGQAIPDNFMGRVEELAVIRQKLAAGGRLMLINAEGGIGKTTLAAKYWQESLYDYQYNAWLFCENGIINELKKLAPKLHIELSNLGEEQQVAALKDGLQAVSHSCLLVLDNADKANDIEQFRETFRGFQWHVLITSRRSGVLDPAQEYRIEHLPPPVAKALFESYYNEGTPAFSGLLDRFLESIGYHTLLIEIFSKYMQDLESDETFNDILEKIKEQGLFLARAGTVRAEWLSTKRRGPATTTEILDLLYDFSALSDEERYYLVNMALLPAIAYRFSFLCELFQQDVQSFGMLKSLARRGWLTYADKSYRISPVIQSIALEKNEATLAADAAAMVDRLNEKLENDGVYLKNHNEAAAFAALAESITRHLMKQPFYALGLLSNNACVYFISIGNLAAATVAAENLRVVTEFLGDKANLAVSYSRLGSIYETQGSLDEALRYFLLRNELGKSLHKDYPSNVSFKHGLSVSYERLGSIYEKQGNLDEALRYFLLQNELSLSLHKDYPPDVSFKYGLSVSYERLGSIYKKQGNLDEALRYFLLRNELSLSLHKDYPSNVSFKHGLSVSYERLGSIYETQDNLDEALRYFLLQNELGKSLHKDYPSNVSLKNGIAISYSKLGSIYEKQGNLDEALRYFLLQNELGKSLHKEYLSDVSFKYGLSVSYERLGGIYEKQGNLDEALRYYQMDVVLAESLHKEYPSDVSFKNGLAISHNRLGLLFDKMGNKAQMLTQYRKAKALLTQLTTDHPKYPEFQKNLQWVQARLREAGES